MTWLRRICSVVALAVLSGVSTHGNAFVIAANPASITAGSSTLVTLEGVLSATALFVVTIGYDPALLSPDLPVDPLSALDDGVTGESRMPLPSTTTRARAASTTWSWP